MIKKILVIALIGILLVPSTLAISNSSIKDHTSSNGKTLYVGGSGPGNYSSIQAAIDEANKGDTIFVFNGTYFENVIVNKTVDLIGEDSETTIIDGGYNNDVVRVFNEKVCISEFTIKNGNSLGGIIVFPDANEVEIVSCIVTENGISGIWIKEASNILIDKCIVTKNSEIGINIGLKSSFNTVKNSTISDNEKTGIKCIFDAANNSIQDCQISDHGYCGVIFSSESYKNSLTDSTITNNKHGVECFNSWNNTIYHNWFIENDDYQAYDNSDDNNWDNGYPSGGNYWDDYTGIDLFSGPDQDQSGSDDIGDTPYAVSGGYTQDNYPLLVPDDEKPKVRFIKPVSGFYLGNRLLRGYILPRTPLIIGDITIEVNATDNESGIHHVDFFLNGKFVGNDTDEPYTYTWPKAPLLNRLLRIFHIHKIQVTAYDNQGNQKSSSVIVRRFF